MFIVAHMVTNSSVNVAFLFTPANAFYTCEILCSVMSFYVALSLSHLYKHTLNYLLPWHNSSWVWERGRKSREDSVITWVPECCGNNRHIFIEATFIEICLLIWIKLLTYVLVFTLTGFSKCRWSSRTDPLGFTGFQCNADSLWYH